ncbi:MAG: PTS sugar transporter subunit IIA [Planctomycetales bacterium]
MEDYDVDSLAAYLHLDPLKVARMVTRGKIPGRKVGGKWRFSRAEIHHWLEERMGVFDEGELVRLETAMEKADASAHADLTWEELTPPEAFAVPLVARSKASVIKSMVELASGTGMLWDPDRLEKAIRQREDLYPTAVEGGVALLHPRRPLPDALEQPFLALGKTVQGVPFGGSGLTDVFFLICSTDDRGHLRVLARLSRLLGTPDFLTELRDAPDAAAARACLLDRAASLD